MKKYRKPMMKAVYFKDELMGIGLNNTSGYNTEGYSGGFSKRNSIVTDDEYLGNDISYNKGIFRSAEENSDDATIVNHY